MATLFTSFEAARLPLAAIIDYCHIAAMKDEITAICCHCMALLLPFPDISCRRYATPSALILTPHTPASAIICLRYVFCHADIFAPRRRHATPPAERRMKRRQLTPQMRCDSRAPACLRH